MIAACVEKRLKGGRIGGKEFAPAHPRTVRLDCIMLRAALKAACDAGFMRDLPRLPKVRHPDVRGKLMRRESPRGTAVPPLWALIHIPNGSSVFLSLPLF